MASVMNRSCSDATVLGLDATAPADKTKIKEMMKVWIENKALKIVEKPGPDRHCRIFRRSRAMGNLTAAKNTASGSQKPGSQVAAVVRQSPIRIRGLPHCPHAAALA